MAVEWFILYKAVFLDRDGLINQQAPEHDYIKSWMEFRFLPGVPEAIHKLNEAGYLVLVVTNQRGVARGIMSMDAVNEIHEIMCRELAETGAYIHKVYVCPHESNTCTCRKPDIGLFLQAEREFEIDKQSSWMVGDSDSDMEAGRKYGVRTIKTQSLLFAVNEILQVDHAFMDQHFSDGVYDEAGGTCSNI
ncbi:MAG: HAD family hydrolase [Clostridia bacterium]|nr:HAD family hydrolase [Clostridia bacterium]